MECACTRKISAGESSYKERQGIPELWDAESLRVQLFQSLVLRWFFSPFRVSQLKTIAILVLPRIVLTGGGCPGCSHPAAVDTMPAGVSIPPAQGGIQLCSASYLVVNSRSRLHYVPIWTEPRLNSPGLLVDQSASLGHPFPSNQTEWPREKKQQTARLMRIINSWRQLVGGQGVSKSWTTGINGILMGAVSREGPWL